jgi:hypothetical protein
MSNVAGMSNVVIHRIFGIYYLFYICKVWCLLIDIKKNKKYHTVVTARQSNRNSGKLDTPDIYMNVH